MREQKSNTPALAGGFSHVVNTLNHATADQCLIRGAIALEWGINEMNRYGIKFFGYSYPCAISYCLSADSA